MDQPDQYSTVLQKNINGMQVKNIQLDKVKMNVIQTAPNGVVNALTIFTFAQQDHFVTASYSGGKIFKGYLASTMVNDKLMSLN